LCAGLEAVTGDARAKILTWATQSPSFIQAVPAPPAFVCLLDQSSRRFLVGIANAPRTEQGLYIVDLGAPGAAEVEAQRFSPHGLYGFPSLEAVLPDRSRVPHLLYCVNDLHHGISSQHCALVNLRSLHMEVPPPPFHSYLSLNEVEVFTGGSGGVCSESAPDTVGRVHVTEPGKDGYRDVKVEITELDCATGQARRTFTRTFRPTATGFVETP